MDTSTPVSQSGSSTSGAKEKYNVLFIWRYDSFYRWNQRERAAVSTSSEYMIV
jgi:hypothetical protein